MGECRVIHNGEAFEGKQGLSYFSGIAAETAGSTGICMHLLEMPPGTRAKAHYHADHETAIFMLEGEVEMLYGDALQFKSRVCAGDFVYIPAGVPHLPYNPFTATAKAVLARTDPNEQESVVLCPELDEPYTDA
ncbi:MAG TPA: cupin domain-containing protein [Fimbriimonadaceae bacterium]|nr:cupin domain-containing protein [Fimbriimonadaceae bacterium]